MSAARGGDFSRLLEHHGASADDVIKAQDRHLKASVRAGDAAHEPAHADMKSRWRHPKRSLGWYRATQQSFAELPKDAPTEPAVPSLRYPE